MNRQRRKDRRASPAVHVLRVTRSDRRNVEVSMRDGQRAQRHWSADANPGLGIAASIRSALDPFRQLKGPRRKIKRGASFTRRVARDLGAQVTSRPRCAVNDCAAVAYPGRLRMCTAHYEATPRDLRNRYHDASREVRRSPDDTRAIRRFAVAKLALIRAAGGAA